MSLCLFDLDGTLIDSIELIVAAFTHTVEKNLGYTIDREGVLSKIGKPLHPLLEGLAPGKGDILTATYREFQYENHSRYVKVFPGIEQLLLNLSEKKIPFGIVTSKGRSGTEAALNLMPAVKDLFSVVITADDSKFHKPDPFPLLQALQSVQKNQGITSAPQNCFYVGDTIYDMQAAVAAEMIPIGVTWGVETREVLSKFSAKVLDEVIQLESTLFDSK